MSLPSVSIVTPCKGRLLHLRQSIPTMLVQDYAGPWEIVVVDYGCPERTVDYVRSIPDHRLQCVVVSHRPDPFNMPRSRNIGGRAASGDIIAFIDCDTLIEDWCLFAGVSALIREGADLCLPIHSDGSVFGCCIVRRTVWETVRGYDEGFEGWGWDDIDFYRRVEAAGFKVCSIPSDCLTRIEHDDTLRMQHFAGRDKQSDHDRNAVRIQDTTRSINPHGFGLDRSFSLVELGQRFATDKGTDHSYLEVYDRLFSRHRSTATRVLEIGCLEGESLRLWEAYFGVAEIVGIDINPVSTDSPRIATILGDAYSVATVESLTGPFDIIIDDGPHSLSAWEFLLHYYTPLLAPGGTLVIEDIHDTESIPRLLSAVPGHLRDHSYTVDRRHVRGRSDDRLLVIDTPG